MTEYYRMVRTPIIAGEQIERIPIRRAIDTRPQLRREHEEFMRGVDRLRARVEALPSMRRLRQHQQVERLAAETGDVLDAWQREQDVKALRLRLDAMAAERDR